jgi:hypothetical protein
VKKPGAHRGKGEGVEVPLLLRVPLGVPVLLAERVQVTSAVRDTLRVPEAVGVGEAEPEAVPVREAPGEGVLEGEGVASAVRLLLRVTEGVRVELAEAVREALREGKQGGGAAPSSTLLRRLFWKSVIHRVEPATARPVGELKRAAVPSAKPAVEPARVLTTTAGQAVTSAMTRML